MERLTGWKWKQRNENGQFVSEFIPPVYQLASRRIERTPCTAYVVSAKLNARAALATSGALPENVNYAVKSSYLLRFLEAVPEVAARLKEPNTKDRKFEDVVQSAEQATVLVLVY